MRRLSKTLLVTTMLIGAIAPAGWASNESNQELGAPYVVQLEAEAGTVSLEFHANGRACADFRVSVDGAEEILVHVGWAAACNYADTKIRHWEADAVDVRLNSAGEFNFDWTTFAALPSGPQVTDDCRAGGWEAFGFRNQGQCVRFVETGKDSR